jgi:diguanylate cyclase (GGDEF)-like protein
MSLLPVAAEPSPRRRARSSCAGEREELAALHETALGLIERLDLAELLQAIIDRAGALVGTPHGYLYVAGSDEATLELRVGTGMFERLVGRALHRGKGLSGRVWESGEPLMVEDYRGWQGRDSDFEEVPCHAIVAVPLHAGDHVTGVLGLVRTEPERSFDDAEVELLTRFSRLASLALENARLYATAQEELNERRQAEDELHATVTRLRQAESEIELGHAESIRRLAFAAEFRNAETGRHTERMSRYCELIARRLQLGDAHRELIRLGSALHDVGKIAIPDRILFKPGSLTESERSVMERHTEIGHRLLADSSSEHLDIAATIALTHHEWFDGTGYPRGLAGDAIPLEGRIAAVADVFDAVASSRVHRAALPLDQAIELMGRGRGTQFDPVVLDLFLEGLDDVRAIAEERSPEHDAPSERPASPPSAREEAGAAARGPARPLTLDVLAVSVRRAKTALARGGGRDSIDLALNALVDGLDRRLLASVYVLEHERLWMVAQRGYEEVRDGFSLDQGVMARAIRTGETQIVADTSADPDFIEAMAGIASEIAAPFTVGGAPAGVLNIETRGVRLPPGSEELYGDLIGDVAERVAEMRAGVGVDLASVARLCVHASSLRGVQAIATFAAQTLARVLELDSAQVGLLGDGGAYQLASFWRRPETAVKPLEPSELKHLAEIEERSGAGAAFSVVEGIVWLPLRVAGGEVGAIAGRAGAAEDLDHERIEAATLFSQHTAALIDVAQALRREQRAAITDPLTRLLNRRGLEDRLEEELGRCRRAGHELSVVMIDCDGLKAVNDTGGHALGDVVLQRVADCLREHKRLADVPARLGGDEFVVLLPETGASDALGVAERFRRELAAAPIADGRTITAALGVASFPADGEGATELLRVADRTLYAAKQAGGNRTLAASTAS